MSELSASPQIPLGRSIRPSWLMPHRVVLALIFLGLIVLAGLFLRWDWVPQYRDQLIAGLGRTCLLLLTTTAVGMLLATLLGLVQVTGPAPLSLLARGFCGIIRGTPLLLQIWLLYYGIGSVLAQYPEIRVSFAWPLLRQAWPYAFLALTLSFAAYEGEVMRGAFAGVPRGELEAAKAYGMGRWKIFRRIWLPRAFHRALPTLAGDMVAQMKSTPLVATITLVDLYGVISRVRQATFLTYEPLFLLALIYMIITAIIVAVFRFLETRVPVRT